MKLEGKRGVVLGVLNKRSLAANCANHLIEQGAQVICSYLPGADADERKLKLAQAGVPAAHAMLPYDAGNDTGVAAFFDQVATQLGEIDFLVHAISMVPARNEGAPLCSLKRSDFLQAMDISVYSLISAASYARKLMPKGGAIVAYSYLSSNSVVLGYETLGICKAALESSAMYLASELGHELIRVNIVSAAPAASSSALANPAYTNLAAAYAAKAPLRRLTSADEVSRAVGFLISDDASGITGERLFIDGGFHNMAAV